MCVIINNENIVTITKGLLMFNVGTLWALFYLVEVCYVTNADNKLKHIGIRNVNIKH